MSSKSILSLFHDLKGRHEFKYIMTRRLNQDVLENLFGIIRQMGNAHDHPCPLTFKYRLKQYMLSHQQTMLSLQPNTFMLDDDSCMTDSLSQLKACTSNSLNQEDDSSDFSTKYCISGELCKILTYLENNEEDEHDFQVPANEKDGFHYVLGYIVHKFQDKYPHLISVGEASHDWISVMYNGGLKRMAPEFIEKFQVVEKLFREFKSKLAFNNTTVLTNMTQIVS